MPRTAHRVTLQTKAAPVNLSDAVDRFAQATVILTQIAKRNGLDVSASLHGLTEQPNQFYENASAELDAYNLAN